MRNIFLTLTIALLLTACGGDGKITAPKEGRISVLELQKSLTPSAQENASLTIDVPEWANEYWPQAGGYSSHSMQHVALGTSLNKLWSASIGKGNTKRIRLNARPIIVAGKIFTLDTENILRATDAATGNALWSTEIADPKEDDPVITGGIAYAEDRIFATNGYNEALSINPVNGKILWRVNLGAPSRAAPTAIDGRVFVTTVDNRIQALKSENGELLWDHIALSEDSALLGGASPAANSDIVVPAFSSGEIVALQVENGSMAWAENLSLGRRAAGLSSITDVTALPVLESGIVVAISYNGRMLGIDERTGKRLWQLDVSGSETPWMAGEYIFVLSSENELIALERLTGKIIWVTSLPRYEDEEDREDPINWMGPVLAGGRLIIAGSHGHLMEISAEDGSLIGDMKLEKSIAFAPIVAGKTLYLLSKSGTLSVYK